MMAYMKREPLDFDLSSAGTLIRAARIYSDVVSPPVIFAGLGFFAAWIDLPFWDGLKWAFLYGLLTCLIPIGVVYYLFKAGRVSDMHMSNTHERHIPYLISMACAVIALAVIIFGGGTPPLRFLALCSIAGLATLGAINMFWLVSGHATSITLAAAFVGVTMGVKAGMFLIPLVGLTGAVRLLLHRHTIAQIVAGMAIGPFLVLLLANLGYIV